ncbi:MAG TPA: hypothetical protein VF711_00175 [Acidimicrobiales bacterium]
MKRRTRHNNIDVADISWRCKTLPSFLEKIERKGYLNPFEEITDRAGVRAVANYKSDCQLIAQIVDTEFEVLESHDKLLDMGVDRFGYGAHHYLVRLKPNSLGPRYDEFRALVCEIQIRSVLQDAWATLQHQLFYKHENTVPSELLRTVNSLSALLENADNRFEELRRERDAYLARVGDPRVDLGRLLITELTPSSLSVYLRRRFPDRPVERVEGQVRRVVSDLDHQRFRLLSDIHDALEEFTDKIVEVGGKVDQIDLNANEQRPSIFDAVWAATLKDHNMLRNSGIPLHWREALRAAAQS